MAEKEDYLVLLHLTRIWLVDKSTAMAFQFLEGSCVLFMFIDYSSYGITGEEGDAIGVFRP